MILTATSLPLAFMRRASLRRTPRTEDSQSSKSSVVKDAVAFDGASCACDDDDDDDDERDSSSSFSRTSILFRTRLLWFRRNDESAK